MKTRQQVKDIAITMVRQYGLINLSRAGVCEKADIPDGSFIHVMDCTFTELLDELVTELAAAGTDARVRQTTKKRVNPALRKQNILQAAVELARRDGYREVTRDRIAEAAGVSVGLVSRYFGNMNQLRIAIMRYAVKQSIPEIVAQGMAASDPQALNASAELKAVAAQSLTVR